ncbi:MAG: C4-type zinc ribbon domain-containing protein [Clostridia bacterium]
MEQTELLWQFQQADMEADALETEMKRSPTRVALKKNRDFLVEQQAAVKRMEEEVAEMLDRVDIIKEAISRMEEQLGVLQKHMQDTPPETLEQAHTMNRDAQKFLNDLSDFEQEMQRIQKDAADRDRLEKDIRMKYAKVKAEYDTQKVEYEAQYKEQMQVLDEKRRIAQEKSVGIDPALLDKYRIIKHHCVPPVAKLLGDQCGGCNMSLPQVTLRNIKSGAKIIECETCGRMLIQL